MPLPAIISEYFSSHFHANEEAGQELENRNASRTQSARSQQIIADITAGVSICSICTDPVALGAGAMFNIWHCKQCYNVYHYNCAKSWEVESTHNHSFPWLGMPAWKCPTCSAPQTAIRGPYCWCGRQEHLLNPMGNPNSCGNICASFGKCAHDMNRFCVENCHPGPCKYPCNAECPRGPISPPRPPTAWDRLCGRVSQRSKGTVRKLVALWFGMAVVYGALGAFLYYHIRWWTMPYEYPNFEGRLETFILIIPGLLALVGIAIMIINLGGETGAFLAAALNLNSSNRKRERTFGALFMWTFFVGLFTLVPLGIFGGPEIAWYRQMKDSCSGLNVRASMDGAWGRLAGRPATRFVVRELGTPESTDDEYYLSARVAPTSNISDDSFQYFHRLSYVGYETIYAVDVDIPNHQYRILNLDKEDTANRWLAYGSRQDSGFGTFQMKPILEEPQATSLRRGNFSAVDSAHQSVLIDDLNLVIIDLWGFIDNCNLEPFLRVFDVTDKKRFDLIPWEWTSKPHSQEVMRTASFGYGRQRLDMCIRPAEYNATQSLGEVTDQVARQLVPFAIIAAYRQRAFESNYRSFHC
ncbi:hypothetical protein BKA64DRAFT_644370 [Cadophora sp. MPI-SDFR-AT-0126]|nr:hypothetical protein BKA64DRAFT_644370 [Leotiomycetes sp. MPI-SDFR-AT-0126]